MWSEKDWSIYYHWSVYLGLGKEGDLPWFVVSVEVVSVVPGGARQVVAHW